MGDVIHNGVGRITGLFFSKTELHQESLNDCPKSLQQELDPLLAHPVSGESDDRGPGVKQAKRDHYQA